MRDSASFFISITWLGGFIPCTLGFSLITLCIITLVWILQGFLKRESPAVLILTFRWNANQNWPILSTRLSIRHELAHKWFGDMVAWGEQQHLWMSESFASLFFIMFLTGFFYVPAWCELGFLHVNDPLLALKSFKPNKYDLLLLDIAMPKMDGFELYELLRKMDPDVKICFITAAEKYCEDLRVENETLSKDLFIQKPLSIRDLVRKIDERINSGSGSDWLYTNLGVLIRDSQKSVIGLLMLVTYEHNIVASAYQ